jgi:hypothetical protein
MICRDKKSKKNVDKDKNNLVFYIGEVHKDILNTFYPFLKRRNNGRKR